MPRKYYKCAKKKTIRNPLSHRCVKYIPPSVVHRDITEYALSDEAAFADDMAAERYKKPVRKALKDYWRVPSTYRRQKLVKLSDDLPVRKRGRPRAQPQAVEIEAPAPKKRKSPKRKSSRKAKKTPVKTAYEGRLSEEEEDEPYGEGEDYYGCFA